MRQDKCQITKTTLAKLKPGKKMRNVDMQMNSDIASHLFWIGFYIVIVVPISITILSNNKEREHVYNL